MKNLRMFLVIIFGCFLFIGCSKDDNSTKTKTTIQLYDKPLPVIKSYLEGKWELHYGKGGFVATNIQYYENFFWEFNFSGQDRIKSIWDGNIIADTTITWNTGGDYYVGETYILSFYDKDNAPHSYVIDGIYNDTLKIQTTSPDAVFFYFTEY